ncbi:WYL domain-containing protein [Enterococcus sp. AZ196]|uniref:WYL domain-containing protein n=1 Tax=Enterococcus sp. AZ196 TaxID=2774659 RepID=UPI003D2CEA4C
MNSSNQQVKRVCDPLKLLYKSQTWYLQAFCLKRNDFRIFKVNLMISLKMLDETFTPIIAPEIVSPHVEENMISSSLAFSEDVLYRLFDDFNLKTKLFRKMELL